MTVIEYAFMLIAAVALAAISYNAWMIWVRPHLARQFGWEDVPPNELIPNSAWLGSIVVLLVILFIFPFFGFAAGYQ